MFFSDAGGKMDRAGIARLADLDQKGIVAGTTSAEQRPNQRFTRSLSGRDLVAPQWRRSPARGSGRHATEGIRRSSDRGVKETALRGANPLGRGRERQSADA
jgi:hypothetical protein